MKGKYCRVVVTCGVSLFGAANATRKWAEDEGLLAFPSQSPNPEPPAGMTEQEALEKWRKRLAHLSATDLPFSDRKRVSAEYSAIYALRIADCLAEKSQIILIHTDSLGGKAAAQMLSVVLKRDFHATVECAEVHINVDDREELRYNLGDFMQKVAQQLRNHDPATTCFAPLGGFKVMTSLGYLAGAYFG